MLWTWVLLDSKLNCITFSLMSGRKPVWTELKCLTRQTQQPPAARGSCPSSYLNRPSSGFRPSPGLLLPKVVLQEPVFFSCVFCQMLSSCPVSGFNCFPLYCSSYLCVNKFNAVSSYLSFLFLKYTSPSSSIHGLSFHSPFLGESVCITLSIVLQTSTRLGQVCSLLPKSN